MKRAPATDPRVIRSRASVLAAALELMSEKGIAGTTIEAVAARSGIAKTTIYRQWDNQQALALDAFATLLNTAPTPDTGTLRGDLLELIRGLAQALTASPAAALMPALIDAAERNPTFAAVHHQEAARRHKAASTALTRAVHRGELSPDADPADVIDLLAGPIFYRRYVSRGEVDETFADLVVDHVLTGLHARARHPHSAPRR